MRKILQMKLYSLLSTKWGMALFLIGMFITFNSMLQFLRFTITSNVWCLLDSNEVMVTPNNKTVYAINDNLCIPKIDVVYTWVNGSDPRHQKALRETKQKLLGELFVLCNATQKEGDNGCTKDETTASRFEDNDELKYSLRSVEKYMPWFNHIYLVTNGQVPHWLNLTNPKLSVVTHEDIFRNKSHLPTFSSPAIESNIHLIKGLADKFVYFNDDTMVGNEVWPDDFYTHSGGQKIFLSWPVPNCNDGCPANWINDGYCDQACNTSDCDWDGEDCKNVTSPTRGGGNTNNNWWNNNNNNNNNNKYCSPGCPDSWIGDKYCDRACKTVDCGWDAGDCDIAELYKNVWGYAIQSGTTLVEVPRGTFAVYFNLSGVVGENKIVDGSHDNADLVRTATISQKNKIMTLTFHRDISRRNVMISITHEVGASKVETVFNVSADTTKSTNGTNSTEAEKLPENKKANATTTAQEYHEMNAPAWVNNQQNQQNNKADNQNSNSDSVSQSEASTSSTIQNIESKGDDLAKEAVMVDNLNDKLAQELPNQDGDKPESSGLGRPVDLAATNETTEPILENVNEALLVTPQQPQTPQVQDAAIADPAQEAETPAEQKEQVENGNETVIEDSFSGRKLLSIEETYFNPMESRLLRIPTFKVSILDGGDTTTQTNQLIDSVKRYIEMFDSRKVDDSEIKNWIDEAITKHKTLRDKRRQEEIKEKYRQENPHSPFSEEFAPWEIQAAVEFDTDQDVSRGYSSFSRRKLLDHYADSLKFVNKLLNKEFGPSSRKVPAHMPHMIDRRIMEDLQEKWKEHWDATSSHQLRDKHDMQFAFSYFYFMAHQRIEYNFENVWRDYLDVNHDGYLDDNELRTLAVHIGGVPVKAGYLNDLKTQLLNCSRDNATIDIEAVNNCTDVKAKIEKHFGKKTKNKHQTVDSDEVAFLMVNNNATTVEKALDGIRERRQKFVCLNDNLNHSDPSARDVVRVMRAFYESLYPLPSSFELPPGVINEHLWMDEIISSRKSEIVEETDNSLIIIAAIVVLFLAIMCLMIRMMMGCTKDPRQQKKEMKYRKILNA